MPQRQTSQPIRFQHIVLNSSLTTIMGGGGQSRWRPMHPPPSTHFLRSNHNSFIAALVRIPAALCELFLRPRRNMTKVRPSDCWTHQAHQANCEFNQKMDPAKDVLVFSFERKSNIWRSWSLMKIFDRSLWNLASRAVWKHLQHLNHANIVVLMFHRPCSPPAPN